MLIDRRLLGSQACPFFVWHTSEISEWAGRKATGDSFPHPSVGIPPSSSCVSIQLPMLRAPDPGANFPPTSRDSYLSSRLRREAPVTSFSLRLEGKGVAYTAFSAVGVGAGSETGGQWLWCPEHSTLRLVPITPLSQHRPASALHLHPVNSPDQKANIPGEYAPPYQARGLSTCKV